MATSAGLPYVLTAGPAGPLTPQGAPRPPSSAGSTRGETTASLQGAAPWEGQGQGEGDAGNPLQHSIGGALLRHARARLQQQQQHPTQQQQQGGSSGAASLVTASLLRSRLGALGEEEEQQQQGGGLAEAEAEALDSGWSSGNLCVWKARHKRPAFSCADPHPHPNAGDGAAGRGDSGFFRLALCPSGMFVAAAG